MLEPEEVDDGYFTPVASTTLASIFKDDSTNDATVNPSLKYRPPQPKKTEPTSKPDDTNASQCVFSCSIIAYEWVQGAHMCKGKVGFAMMRIEKTGQCKAILYSPEKSTLSCITIVPQLEVTVNGAMISLYDDHKKYWGLSFNEKIIDKVKELLKNESVIIKQYVKPEFKPDTEHFDSDEAIDETDSSGTTEDNASTTKSDKVSILNRIANVGHAILPSFPGSPAQKSTPVDVLSTQERRNSISKLNVSDKNMSNNITLQQQDNKIRTRSIAIQASQNDATSNCMKQSVQTSATTLPLINNQIFTYVNGYMVPLHMQVPVIGQVEIADATADIEQIIQKLTHLKGVIKTLEMRNNVKQETQLATCKCHEMQNMNLKIQNDLKKISDSELLVKEKEDFILKLQNEVQNEIKKNNDIQKKTQFFIKESNEQKERLNTNLNLNNEELKQMIQKKELDVVLANTVKSLMNTTFRSLARNFDSEESYTGNNVKAVLAAVIKKNTVETLRALFCNEDTSNNSTKLAD